MAVREKRRSTILATVGILVALVATNTAAWFVLRSARIDVTEEKLYTISPGVNELVRSLPEPVKLDFYWTREQGADLPTVRAYAQRVQEFLEEVAGASGGMLELRVIDPEPFSETEDMARAAGIAPRTLDTTGRVLMFGLAVRGPTDKVESIPFLDPAQEPFLEYEIARRILSVGRDKKSVVAVLSTIPEEKPFNPRNPMAQGGKNILFQQLDLLYDVKRLDKAKPEIPTDATALVVIQPRMLSVDALKTIDAWAVSGKPLVIFADPWCEADPEARNMDFGSTGAGTTYDLGPLLAQWGVDIDKENAVADLGFATRIMYRTQGGQVMEMSHPAWLSMRKEALAAEDPVTAPLAQMNLKGAGAIVKSPTAKTSIEPIISSTKDVQMIQTLKLGFFGEVDRLVRDFKSLGTPMAIAVRIKGELESAYPSADGARAKGNANILLVADADMVMDDTTWIQVDQQSGEARQIADNGLFVFNALEQATGDRMLSGLKSRGRYQRPFDRVEQLRKDAESRYLVEEQQLEDEIKKSEMRINELQRERGGTGAGVDASGMLVLSPEQVEELKKLETTQIEARRKLREVQRSLRADIEKTGTALMVLNVIVWPLAVAFVAKLWISIRYSRQRSGSGATPLPSVGTK
ncbi:MAG: GldG family protein [Planctomycetaceae bacterium]|nr:GldG family protein [Planctomycetaceae bacterium]